MKINLLRISFLVFLFSSAFTLSAQAQQEKLPQQPEARRQVMQALQILKSQLPTVEALSASLHADKYAAGDSLEMGAIAGRIEGVTPEDSAWVLAVAAHLYEDPTAWSFGEVKPEGDYVITGLKAGIYIIMAGADEFLPQFFSRAYAIWEAIPVDVAPNGMTEGIDFFLEPSEAGEGSISGRVIAENTEEPVSGAQIYIFHATNPFISAWTTTNDDGTYELNGLRTGSYYVQAYANGYFQQFYDGAPTFEGATPVPITDGELTSGIDFALNRGGTISGTAVDAQGNPIAGASIQAYTYSDRPDDYAYWYGWASTDAAGNYTISGLYTGDYIVSLHHYSHYYSVTEWYDDAETEQDATPVPVTLGEDTAGIDFVIDTPTEFGSIAGRAVDENGTPVHNAIVRVESISSPNFYYYNYGYPDENGYFELEHVPAGAYRVVLEYWTNWYYDVIWYDGADSPEHATPVEVAADQQLQDIDFVVPVAEGVVSGVVINSQGRPVANASIQLNNYARDYYYEGVPVWAYANTDKDGRYRIEGLPDGEYFASAFFCYFWECTQRWWPDSMYEEHAEAIVIKDGQSDPASVDFELPLEFGDASLSGTVNHIDGHPLAGALVSISPDMTVIDPDPTGSPDYPWVSEMHTYTDGDGAYSFDYLPAGTYVLYASYWEEGASGFAWYENAADIADATPIDVGENDAITGIDFSLDVRSYYGSISGTVVLEDGTPIERAYVEVQGYYRAFEDRAIFPAEWFGVTDADGTFQIDNLYEGEYLLSVFAQGAMRAYMDSSGVDITQVKVTGGEVTAVEIGMIAQNDGPAEIGGVVAGEQGEALEIGIVRAIPVTDSGAAYYTAISDENGVYRLTGLPEGSYYVQARAPWHITEYYDNTFDPAEAELVETRENLPAESIDFSLDPIYYYVYAGGGVVHDQENAGQASVIFGAVRNDTGEALAGATVYIVDTAGQALASAETFEDGMYEIAGLQPGSSYRIKATHVGYESQFNGAASDVSSAPAMTVNGGRYEVNFALTRSNTSVEEEEEPALPRSLKLLGNYPNPFSGETNISFSIPKSARVSVEVYDALGRKVESVFDGALPPGAHSISWDPASGARAYPSGLYFYRITTDKETAAGSMTMLR